MSPNERRLLINNAHSSLSIADQAKYLGIGRATVYYVPHISAEDLNLMNEIDRIYTKCPFYGSRRIRAQLWRQGYQVGRRHVCSLMKRMGIEAIYPKPNTSIPNKAHKVYPYLLRNLPICRPNQVWGTDITYIRLRAGFIYLMAILDWYSRYVISWRLSNALETDFCIEALEEGLLGEKPDICNSDQGSQFTSNAFTGILEDSGVAISMDGRGRAMDNIFTERLWRSVKYEEVYLKDYASLPEAHHNLKQYFHFYNNERLHQSLDYLTPTEVHFSATHDPNHSPRRIV